MADIIQLLPESVANQIAAGEVIQRPASVVKELMENAIDAKSSFIQLIIKDAGKSLIQLIDDGIGMSDIDARMSFERHATSKIKEAAELFAIKTMGFRGEALASIASIAQVEMTTRQEESELATHIVMQGSEIKKQEYTQANKGTSIAVKQLFYNVPARRKFLKTDSVEYKHILEEFKRVALANPGVRFTLIHNDNEVYHLPAGNLRKRIVGIFGKNQNEKLVPVHEETDILTIDGFIGKPEAAKRQRGDQYFFVNSRFIKSNYLNHAIKTAFGELISKEHYAFYVINLQIDPSKIDINIHPTKTEIKFEEERLIYQYLKVTTQHALGKYSVVPTLDFQQQNGFINPTPQKEGSRFSMPNAGGNFSRPSRKDIDDWSHFYENISTDAEQSEEQQVIRLSSRMGSETDNHSHQIPDEEQREAYQIHGSYIITPIQSGYLVIHQQFAHERILFERYIKQIAANEKSTQQQLFPIQISFEPDQANTLLEMLPIVQSLGLDIHHFGDQTFVIQGVPAIMTNVNIEEILIQAVHQYESNLELKVGLEENVARSIAKSASIRKGKLLNQEEMLTLISELFACEVPFISPSGRKCFIEVELNQLEKQF